MCALPDRSPGLLSTLLTSTTGTLVTLLDRLRARASDIRAQTGPIEACPSHAPFAAMEAAEPGLPALPLPAQPQLPPTGIQLFIAPPLPPVVAPAAADEPSTASDAPTDGGFAAGVAMWVASLPRPRLGDGPTMPIGELRRRLELRRANHRLTRTGLLLLTIAAPFGVAFVIAACIEVVAGR